jgi:excisionase family DNA binding protein
MCGVVVMTLEEAANFLEVSETTVYQLLREGQLKALKVGREWRSLESGLVSYLKEGVDVNEAKVMSEGQYGY